MKQLSLTQIKLRIDRINEYYKFLMNKKTIFMGKNSLKNKGKKLIFKKHKVKSMKTLIVYAFWNGNFFINDGCIAKIKFDNYNLEAIKKDIVTMISSEMNLKNIR